MGSVVRETGRERAGGLLRRLWQEERLLMATGALMLAVLPLFLLGLLLDPRTVTGVPAWLKPAKFAASTALYSVTLAWVFLYLRDWPRLRRRVARITSGVFVLEVALIAIQAGRGRSSHFNVATALDAFVFGTMGLAIVVQTLSVAVVAVALWRQPFADRALGWALRLGIVLSVLGASVGGLMTRPTRAQLADMKAGQRPLVAGAHTVGARDGGPGLPGVGWSTRHGDLRAPHFVGLHALQVLPLLSLLWRRRSETARLRLTLAAAAAYAVLFAALLVQALAGHPLLALG